MTKQLKGLIVVVSIGIIIYFVFSANTLVAEHDESRSHEQFAGAVISVEASLVVVKPEIVKDITGGLDKQILSSVSPEKIMSIVRQTEDGEVISVVCLAVGNGIVAEIETEDIVEEKMKISDEEKGEHEDRKSLVSFRVVPKIIDINRIAVSLEFKQIMKEGMLSAETQAEKQRERNMEISMTGEVVLRPGQPKIVGAVMKNEAIFLIMSVDI